MKPSVCRIVHYYTQDPEPQLRAAIITKVFSDVCVNLEVFGETENTDRRFPSSVLMVPEGATPQARQWTWPPRT
jgi:hypothetical protein